MIPPFIPGHERERLAALHRYAILDTSSEDAFEDIVQLASSLCDAPIALITFLDATRQWFKARLGMEVAETPRAISFCGHAIYAGDDVFVVEDARADPRFADNPLVTGSPHVRFYAGASLVTSDGYKLGTLCVIDGRPRALEARQRTALAALARQVMAQLELRRQVRAHRPEVPEGDAVERLKREFLSTVNHELRTPLTSIRGSLGLLASGAVGALTAEALLMVSVAERNSLRLIALVDDMLDFDELASGRMELDLRPTPLARVLERAIGKMRALAAQEGVRLELHCPEVTVMADEARLTQVTANLLSNAVKYSPRGGTVTVAAVADRGWAEVRVQDRGRGIAPELRDRLFRGFQRADSSDSRTTAGAGLGLAICKAIVEQHGGSIGFGSTEGEGSTFWFRIAGAPGQAAARHGAATRAGRCS